jgi:catalase-peroxidase
LGGPKRVNWIWEISARPAAPSTSPAGATEWIPSDNQAANLVPDAFDPNKRHAPMMFTTDLALKEDPTYRAIALRFRQNPAEFELAFAKAWFKLTHRDMGPAFDTSVRRSRRNN